MMKKENFHAARVLSEQRQLEEQFEQLQKECARRRTHLRDAVKYHAFVRQSDDLSSWLKEKGHVAAEDDNGRDLEECQRIADEFEQVLRELSAAGERVAGVQRQSEELLRGGHSLSASIRAKATDLNDLWREVNEAANERQQALVGAKMVHKFDQDADEMLHWLGEKEALQVAMDSEDLSCADLNDVQRLLQKHEEFARGLVAVERQVAELCREAEKLEQLYPATHAHLDVRRQDMEMQLNDVLSASEIHRKRLEQTQLLQAYFAEHRALITWIRHMQTVITSEVLPRDVSGCEALDARHAEYKTEIGARLVQKNDFANKGLEMIRVGNMLSSEIQAKITSLDAAFKALNEVWEMRRRIYEENSDAQLWRQEAALLERWLTDRENMLVENWNCIDNVETAEDHLRNFDDFLVTLEAQSDKFQALQRLTLIEKSFAEIRERESQILSLSISQPESRRETQTIKTLEKKKLLQEKRQDRERRKTQEISLLKPSPSLGDADLAQRDYMSLPRPRTTSTGSDSTPKVTVTATPATVVPGPSTERRSSGEVGALHYVPDLPASTAATPTPTFTTRRSHSLNKPRPPLQDHSSIDMFGFIERKQVLQTGGKKATIRAWKKNYTILCGQLICFFKDEATFVNNQASSPPIYILGARCEQAVDYSRRKNVFRLQTTDGSEYLFECTTETEMVEWINKIQFHANLSPANQLQSFRKIVGAPSPSVLTPLQAEDGAPAHTPPPKPELTPRRFTADSPKTFGFIGSLKRKS
uniref:PH domain-containing protein n=1 Tax=Steinernema glaseri TaxID=37863 RepID=A0A1I7ZAM9_9BILA